MGGGRVGVTLGFSMVSRTIGGVMVVLACSHEFLFPSKVRRVSSKSILLVIFVIRGGIL